MGKRGPLPRSESWKDIGGRYAGYWRKVLKNKKKRLRGGMREGVFGDDADDADAGLIAAARGRRYSATTPTTPAPV